VIALLLGTLLTLAALTLVLFPLFREGDRSPPSTFRPAESPDEVAIAALREVEFDRATGKLSDEDYAELKALYTREAIAVMRDRERGKADALAGDAEVEAMIRRYRAATDPAAGGDQRRACSACGPRPEGDAIWCSSCGGFLGEICPQCSAVVETSARFCSACGTAFGAASLAAR
jgi:hypothetical protein